MDWLLSLIGVGGPAPPQRDFYDTPDYEVGSDPTQTAAIVFGLVVVGAIVVAVVATRD